MVDEAGAAIAGARVELLGVIPRYEGGRRVAAGVLRPEIEVEVASARDGWYRLPVPEPGMWQVEISAAGKIPVRRRLIPLLEDRELPEAELERDGGVWIRVEDEEGRAVAGAQVGIHVRWNEAEQRFQRRDRAWEDRGRFGLSDEAGNLLLSRHRGTAIEIYAYARGFLPSVAQTVEGERATIRLERGRRIEVRFLTADGEPAAQALLRVGEQRWPSVTTDHRGRAPLFVRAGEPLAPQFAILIATFSHTAGGLFAERGGG